MYKCFLKRFFDFIVAFCALPFVLLMIMIMAPIIYFDDKGPIFYNATRTGKGCKLFKMFKLRSMYVNSPDLKAADGSTYNADDDPRVTKVGHFMRKTSIDEIPQLLNVLIGDMSFIGPRPTLGKTQLIYEELDEIRKKRYSVLPGITGYAQAYFRNSITQDEKFKNDAFYVEHLTMWMDFKVFWKTVESVLGYKNIYVKQ
jgi:lipopolysaccharide/colanic/teichoic acid biosynthesis glycosyltransferase